MVVSSALELNCPYMKDAVLDAQNWLVRRAELPDLDGKYSGKTFSYASRNSILTACPVRESITGWAFSEICIFKIAEGGGISVCVL